MSIDVRGIKEGQKAMWTAGDYGEVAQRIVPVGEYVAERAGAGAGVELLDVATGTGNVSVPAARAGAKVTGLDLTPKLLEEQRARAAAAGVDVELVEGDAEELPFADASFDRVTSCFGVMFAPRQAVAAAELVRVARPGGRIVVAAWTPNGMVGRMFRASASYLPTPPDGFVPPVMWGEERHVRGLFENSGVELEFERRTIAFEGDSVEAWVEQDERILGPSLMAKAALEQQGRYDELRRDVIDLYEEFNEVDDGGFRAPAEYLITVAQLPS
ncbi:MAG TPA: methyltransferase domain-containing protein [Solirubrobacteraceae bacterium]|jgi:SAM-dependent methyltransferase|nr:methyltransferase domain-containing protein [Solirubrobacteraceae bacterium]